MVRQRLAGYRRQEVGAPWMIKTWLNLGKIRAVLIATA